MEDFDVNAMIRQTVSGAMEAVEAAQQAAEAARTVAMETVQDVHAIDMTDADLDALIAENGFGNEETPAVSPDTDLVDSLMEEVNSTDAPTPSSTYPPRAIDSPIDLGENGEGIEENTEASNTENTPGETEAPSNEELVRQCADQLVAAGQEALESNGTDEALSAAIDRVGLANNLDEEVAALVALRLLLVRDYHYDLPPVPAIAGPLPQNSPTLLVDETTTRFSGAEWFKEIQKSRIIVGGIGGIGSWLSFQLARMKPAKLVMYDDDKVEMLNMAGQLFSIDDVTLNKVSAMHNMIRRYTNMENVYSINEKFTPDSEPGDIMMCGFDNMRARKMFYHAWETHVFGLPIEKRGKCLFLDGRLSMDTIQILAITGDDRANQNRYWKEFLFSDTEAEATVCSMKQTTYLACMIGSLMVNIFTNFIANTINPIIPYDVPFYLEYDAQNMIFRTEK